MMNGLNVFNNEKFGMIRTATVDGVVWFFGRDVVECLGYEVSKTTSYTKYTNQYVRDKYQLKLSKNDIEQLNSDLELFKIGQRGEVLINQYGIIQLVMASPLPQAEAFQDWVIEEVIPAVLTTGSYTMTRQFTPLESAIGTIIQGNATPEELGEAIYTLSNVFRQKGKAELCQEGTINISQIIAKMKEMYPDRFGEYVVDIASTEWNKFMRRLGYIRMVKFPCKNGHGFECYPVPQPTQKFFDELEAHGMAIARLIPDDRGKREIKYTTEIFKLLEDKVFIDLFFDYLDMTHTRKDDNDAM